VLEQPANSYRWLETENDSALVTEVALVVIAFGKVVAESRQHKVKLRWSDGNGVGHGNIDSSADDEVESIVAWILCASARTTRQRLASREKTLVCIGVGATEERFHKWFEMLCAVLEYRTHVVGEEIAARSKAAT